MNKLFPLRTDPHRQRLKMWIDALQLDPSHPLEAVIRDPKRTLTRNAELHALLNEVAVSRQWAGRSWDVTVWKRLLVAAFLRARGESPIVLPALDGHGIEVVHEPTREMSEAMMRELCMYIRAWLEEEAA